MRRTTIVLLVLTLVTAVGLARGNPERNEADQAERQGEAATAESTSTSIAPSSKSATPAQSDGLADGIYFAMEDHFNPRTGWRHNVTIEVRNGRIVSASWNGAHREGGTDKVTRSENGKYGMRAHSRAHSPWFEQAASTQRWLLEHQDPTAIRYADAQGRTDAVSGVSIRVAEFFDLAAQALEQGPVGYGPYRDGVYTARDDSFENGWRDTVSVTVVSGYIVAAELDALSEEGDSNKEEASIDGAYRLPEEGAATTPWYEQMAIAQEWLIQNQDPGKLTVSEAGGTGAANAIPGVTVAVEKQFSLVQEALRGAGR